MNHFPLIPLILLAALSLKQSYWRRQPQKKTARPIAEPRRNVEPEFEGLSDDLVRMVRIIRAYGIDIKL